MFGQGIPAGARRMKSHRSHVELSCVAVLLLGCPWGAGAYAPPTHQQMSINAANASVLSQASTLSNLGLLYNISDNGQTFPNSVVLDQYVTPAPSRTIIELIQDGAAYEDSSTVHRSLNH